MRRMGSLCEWDALAPLAAGVALVLWAVWPDPRQTPAPLGDDLLNALEDTAAGQAAPWSDPASGKHGLLVPSAIFRASNGQWCRAYQISLGNVAGRPDDVPPGTAHVACRLIHGGWRDQPAVAAHGGGPGEHPQLAAAHTEEPAATPR